MQGGPAKAAYRAGTLPARFEGQGWPPHSPVSGPCLAGLFPSLSPLRLGVCPKCGLCVSPSISASGQVPWAFIGCLGPGQVHPGVSIETADPGCEFLVLENPVWWL